MCKGTSHWAASSSASQPHSDLPIPFPKGTRTALSEETVNYSGTFIFLLFSSMLCSNGLFIMDDVCLFVFFFLKKKKTFSSI